MNNNSSKSSSMILKRNNLKVNPNLFNYISYFKILEKAFELKGILSSSEDYWKNNSNSENNYSSLKDENYKEKIKNFSEVRNSVTSCESNLMNSTYSYTQTSEYNLNDSIKEENSIQKHAEFSNCTKKTTLNDSDVTSISNSKISESNFIFDQIKNENFINNKFQFYNNKLNIINSNKNNKKSLTNFERIFNNQEFNEKKNNKNENFIINKINYPNTINSLNNSNNQINNNKRKTYEKKMKKSKVKIEWKRLDDIKIIELVEIYNFDWPKIASIMNKPENMIKKRFEKRLDPKLKFSKFTTEEDNLIINLYKIYGSTWNFISRFFPNRSSIMIKNRFYSTLKKTILCQKDFSESSLSNLDNFENPNISSSYLSGSSYNYTNENFRFSDSLNESLNHKVIRNSNKLEQTITNIVSNEIFVEVKPSTTNNTSLSYVSNNRRKSNSKLQKMEDSSSRKSQDKDKKNSQILNKKCTINTETFYIKNMKNKEISCPIKYTDKQGVLSNKNSENKKNKIFKIDNKPQSSIDNKKQDILINSYPNKSYLLNLEGNLNKPYPNKLFSSSHDEFINFQNNEQSNPVCKLLIDKENLEKSETDSFFLINNNDYTNRKNSLNDLIYYNSDNLSVKSSFNNIFEKIDINNEKDNLQESDQIKIFSNLNTNNKEILEYEEDDETKTFEKIRSLKLNKCKTDDHYNYFSLFEELIEYKNDEKFEDFKELILSTSDKLTEIELFVSINKITNQKSFIEKSLKSFEEFLMSNPNSNAKNYENIQMNILKKIEFLVQVIRILKTKISSIRK